MLVRSSQSRWHSILITGSKSPYLNLAQELVLLNAPPSREQTLYLWQNAPVVVIGKHQNPYRECNLPFMRDHNVALARRPTGGGAVYQDLGNSCWTFLGPEFDPQSNNAILIDALSRLGIQASPTGRNDLEVANRKVSGAAFRRTPFRSIHHGTLLRDVNMDMLAQCLTVDPAKLKAKGLPSVRSRVLNLCERWPELTHDAFCRELIDAFQRKHGQVRVEKIGEHEMLDNADVKKTFAELSAHDWLFGTWSDSAPFSASKKFDFGLFEVSARVDNGKVTECAVNTDCLSTDVVELFKAIVIGGTPTNHLRSDAEREMLSQLTTWFLPQIHLTRS